MSIYLGEKIKTERKKKGLLQKDLCCEGITKSTISKIENNTLIPSLIQLDLICKILKIEMFQLFLDENNVDLINKFRPLKDYNSSSEANFEGNVVNIKSFYDNKDFFKIIELFTSPTQCSLFSEAYYTGMSHFEIKEFLYSQKYLKRAITLFKSLDYNDKKLHAENLANGFNTLGKISYIKKDYSKALHYFYKCKTTIECYNFVHTELYVTVINNISSIYCITFDYDKAIYILEKFLKQNISEQYIFKLASIHVNLNLAYFKTYNFEKSIFHIKKAIILYNYLEKHYPEGECYLNYVNALRYNGNFTEAFNILNYAIKTYNFNKLKDSLLVQKLVLFYNLEEFNSILTYHSLVNLKKTRETSIKNYYFIMGHVEFVNNNFKKSHSYYDKCINFLVKNKFYLDLSVVYNDLGIILDSKEYLQKSLYFKKMYFSLKNKPLRTNITLESSSEFTF